MSATFTTRDKVGANGKKKWYVLLRLDGWNTERFGGYTEKDAYAKGIELVSDYNKGKMGHVRAGHLSVEAAVEEFLNRAVSDKTNDLWRSHLVPFVSKYNVTNLKQIDKLLLRRVHKDMKDAGAADGYISLRLRGLRAFINFCLFKKYLTDDPWPSKFEQQGGKKLIPTYRSKGYSYTDEELVKLATLPAGASVELTCLVRAINIALHQGWREEHIWAASWDRYDATNQKYYLQGMKGASDKWVRVHPITLKAFGEVKTTGRIFSLWGRPDALGLAFRRWRKRLGIPRGRFHDLKHSCVSRLTQQGFKPAEIEEITGTSRAALAYYTHADTVKTGDRFIESKMLPSV